MALPAKINAASTIKELTTLTVAPTTTAFIGTSFKTRRAVIEQAAKLMPGEGNVAINPTLIASAAAIALVAVD